MSDYEALATQAQDKNRKMLIHTLRTLGVMTAKVDYAGAGDSGDTCDLSVQPPELLQQLSGIKVKQHVLEVRYIGYGQRTCAMRETEVELDEAVRDFAMRWVESLYGGWEIDDGASGCVTINVNDDTVELEHTAYYTESTVYGHAM